MEVKAPTQLSSSAALRGGGSTVKVAVASHCQGTVDPPLASLAEDDWLTARQLLRIQLDDQLLLRRDRNVRACRTLEHPAAERVAIDREPGQRDAARRLFHRGKDRLDLARLLADPNLLARRHGEA